MGSIGDRVKRVRLQRGLSLEQLAERVGVRYQSVQDLENGRSRGTKHLLSFARALAVRPEWLEAEEGPMESTDNPSLSKRGGRRGRPVAQVVGYVGAGAEVIPVDDHAQGNGLDEVELPPGVELPCVAARIRGDSMYPWEDGWLVFWAKDQDGVPDDCINKICVVKLSDGRMFVKRLRRGLRGRFSLESWNAPTMENVAVEWAAKIIGIKPL